MKTYHCFFPGILICMLAISWQQATSQKPTYNLEDTDTPYVFIQLKPVSNKLDSLEATKIVKDVVDQIKLINTNLGYKQFEKKIASIALEENGKRTTYVAIRNFTDFASAETYASEIAKDLPRNIYGRIKAPFPISGNNYKLCITAKDFESYYKAYKSSKN
jgi:hypothetical protein